MRNLPLIFLTVVIVTMMIALLRMPRPEPVTIVPEPEPVNQKAYTGRMVMPSINDIYVLENSAGRDIVQLEKFLQGRAAGLHWLAADYFRNKKRTSRRKSSESSENMLMGIKLTLDSLGQFHPEILFSNVDNADLKQLVCEHIQTFWRYPRSTGGKLDMWAPFVWKNVWNPKEVQ